jgi:hypothetical protein
LGTFWVQSVDYGTSLDRDDFNTPVLKTFYCRQSGDRITCGTFDDQESLSVNAIGQKSLVVTRKVMDDWTYRTVRGLRSQFRLRFGTDVSTDTTDDYVTIYTRENSTQTNWPRLYIEYEYE